MSIIVCSGCGERFEGDRFGESPDFDMHDCPSTQNLPKVKRGESFEDYEARCKESKS